MIDVKPPKYLALPNLSSQHLEPLAGHPADVSASLPDYMSKGAKKEWTRPEYQGYFISLGVAENPVQRPSKDNPVTQMSGLIIDIDDCGEDMPGMVQKIHRGIEPIYRPSWVARSASGHGFHLMYEWPSSQPVPSAKLFEYFVKAFVSDSKLNSLPGEVDLKGSMNPAQFFEIGREWTPIREAPTADSTLIKTRHNAYKMVKTCRDFGRGLPISMAIARKTLSDKYGMCGIDWNEFGVGYRCHRFWDPVADNSSAAVVYENGIYAWSTGEFIRWSDTALIGPEATEDAEDEFLHSSLEGLWFDGRTYWHEISTGWVTDGLDATKRKLKIRGLSGACRTGESVSQVDRALHLLHELRLEGAGPMMYYRAGLVTGLQGGRFLNTSTVRAYQITPSQDDPPEWGVGFPIIADYFDHVWVPEDKEHMLYWIKDAWECGRNFRPHRGLGVLILGPPNVGKNWLALGVIAQLLGGHCDPGAWLTGVDPLYNGAYVGSPLWYVSDVPKISKDRAQHRTFGSNLKKVMADDQLTVRNMHQAPYNAVWNGRVVIACNTDPDSLQSLPNTGALYDKMSVFELNNYTLPYYPTDEEIRDNELEAFARFLESIVIPEAVKDQRYGLKPYTNVGAAELVDADDFVDHRGATARRLILEYVKATESLSFKASELLEVSSMFQAGFAETVRKTFANATYLGRTLTLMKREHPKGLRQHKIGGVAKYEISQRLLDEWERMA
jgi:hypothetical protein